VNQATDDSPTYAVRLDKIHRHWPLAIIILGELFVVWSMVLTWQWHYLPRYLAAAALGGGLGWIMWWGYRRCRISVFETCVVEQGHIGRQRVRFDDVRLIEHVLDGDSLGVSDAGIAEFFASLFAMVTVRPVRWVLRRFVYGARSDTFYRGVLLLRDREDEIVMRIEASSGWENVEELFARIDAAFVAHGDRRERLHAHQPTE
jgi:hypothetical protein